MKKLMPSILALAVTGCDAPDSGLVIQGVIMPSVMVDMTTGITTCTWDPTMATSNLVGISIDVAQQLSLFLVLRVQNTLQPSEVVIDEDPDNLIRYSDAVSPLRFDYRWECDTIGFGADLGAMILPQFSVNQPFCLDTRDETGGDFVGFDVIPATGAAIPPNGIGGVEIRPVPAQLGLAVYDMFTIAALAQKCCGNAADGCAGVENGDMECDELADLFNDVGILQNQADAAARFRPFALFDGAVPPANMFPTNTYQMRIRGVLEGVTTSGDTVTSNEWAHDIGFGRNIGGSLPCTAIP